MNFPPQTFSNVALNALELSAVQRKLEIATFLDNKAKFDCFRYTYDGTKGRCFMKSAISSSYKTSEMTSGLKANSNNGQGCSLRNIKISGGTAQTIKLQRTEDCLQYCTSKILRISQAYTCATYSTLRLRYFFMESTLERFTRSKW